MTLGHSIVADGWYEQKHPTPCDWSIFYSVCSCSTFPNYPMWYAGLTLVFISSGQNINTQIICWCPHWLSVLQILFEGRFFLNHQSSIYAARFHVFSFWIEESFNLDHQPHQNLLLPHQLYLHLFMKCLDNDHRQVCIWDHFCGKYILQKCNLWCNHIEWL